MKPIPVRKINTIQSEPNLSESFSIRDIKDMLSGKDMVQELHRHDFFFILLLKKGMGSHEIDFTTYEVSDNSVFLMRPGQVHHLNLKAGSTGFLMQFKTDFYHPHDKASNQQLIKASTKNYCQLDRNRFKKLFSIMAYIFQEYMDKKEGYQEVVKANLGIFFIELVRNRQPVESTSNQTNVYSQEQLEKFLHLLETHIATHKQVAQYADMMNLTPYQLNSITKATLNKTCSELINEYITLESKRYLLATSNQVNQIANYLGFDDVSYFIRFFKKHSGFSPEVFRHNFR